MAETSSVRARKVRLYLKPAQAQVLDQWAYLGRQLWNAANEQYETVSRFRRQGRGVKYPTSYGQQKELTVLRKEDEMFRGMPRRAQCSVLDALQKAWKAYWTQPRFGRPKFKSRRRSVSLGFHGPETPVEDGKVKIPTIGYVKVRGTPQRSFVPVRSSLVKEPDGWYISFLLKMPPCTEKAPEGSVVGLDRGVAVAIADSEGVLVENPRFKDRERKRLRRLERGIARQQDAQKERRRLDTLRRKGGEDVPFYTSKRLQKRMNRKAKIEKKIARRRDAWQHQVTTDYARRFETVVIEDLKTSNMTKSAKGTAEEPGKNVKAKSGLNRAILDVGWFGIESKLAYKLEERGGQLVKVMAAYTSQTCNACGHTDPKNRQTQADFRCVNCGYETNADVGAACNIRDRHTKSADQQVSDLPQDHGAAARGGFQVAGPVNREPTCTDEEASA